MFKKPAATYEKVETTLVHELPASINREIGKIIVRWSYLEYCVQKIVWLLAGVPEIVGRFAIREPRFTDRLEMIRDLAPLRGIKWSEAKFQAYLQQATAAQNRRDLLAHGLWTKYPDGTLRVIHTRGQHPKNRTQVPHRSRKVSPEALFVTVPELQMMISRIDLLITEAVSLERDIQAQFLALPDKSE